MTDKQKALEIWLKAATYYDMLSANTPRDTEIHTRHFEEHNGWMFDTDGSYTTIVAKAYNETI
jgi:hypothetical protein